MTWEAKNIADSGSTLVMKFRKKKIVQKPNWLREVVVKPGCYAELLITDITVSVLGENRKVFMFMIFSWHQRM